MVLCLGSNGPLVRRLEQRLTALGLYTGALDGVFGAGVESAVKSLQTSNKLVVSGSVDETTWQVLFPSEPLLGMQMLGRPIGSRCLALTGAFETSTGSAECFSAVAGNFDGQGISLGALQWNFGKRTLQPLLTEMLQNHWDKMQSLFGKNLSTVQTILAEPLKNQLEWARSIQSPTTFTILEPWKDLFSALGRTPEFQAVQLEHATRYQTTALSLCKEYELSTERGLALMFDIAVQNGSINTNTRGAILSEFKTLSGESSETARLQIIANRMTAASSPTFASDVRCRKLTIANGQGTVHGTVYNLEQQFGIRLEPFIVSPADVPHPGD